jgi:MarR family 2-MHQ and catechol resistance regulon transcriptional repressor
MKAHRTLEHVAVRSIEATELGLSDFGVLELLLHKGPQPVNEIGRHIGLTSGAITIAVDRLAAQRLVVREALPTDRRTRIVCLSPRGRKQAALSFAAHKKAMDEAGAALARNDRAVLIRLLKKLGTSVATSET